MSQGRQHELHDVVRHGVIASPERGERSRALHQRNTGPWRRPHMKVGPFARRADQFVDLVDQPRIDANVVRRPRHLDDLFRRRDRIQFIESSVQIDLKTVH